MVKIRPDQRNTDVGSISRTAHTRTRSAQRNGFHCTEAVYDARSPVGRSDGCLSTTRCHATCVMDNTRPDQRNTDAGSISRSAHTRTTSTRAPRNGFNCTEAVCNAHRGIGPSEGCLSTLWYQPRCAMVKTRPAQRNTDAGSIFALGACPDHKGSA